MKISLIIFLVFCNCCLAQDLAYVSAYGSKIYFEPPDTNKWQLEKNEMNERGVYVLTFKHLPMLDSLGREIQPIMSVIIERVQDSSDVILFSIYKRQQVPFHVRKVLTYEDGHFEYRNVVGYEGDYNREEVLHRVFVVHMRGASIGLQSICDATDGVYTQVESDMRRFIKNIGIDK
jgi:hypothetical protein